MNGDQIRGTDTLGVKLIKEQFNSIVAENYMKSKYLQPTEGEFDFSLADQFVEFGEENNMYIVGHTLVWHSQAPEWFFIDKNGEEVSRDLLIERMRNHIHTVVGRYKGRIKGWDVVNEAMMDDGSYRQSNFYKIIGEDFIKLAFQFAQEADPDAKLHYNEYSLANPQKREGVIKMIEKLQSKGVKIDGIGMQTHLTLTYPTVSEFEKSLLAFSNLGLDIMISELDITVLPAPNPTIGAEESDNYEYDPSLDPYPQGLPDSVAVVLNDRLHDYFKLFAKHSDKITRVTVWGTDDGMSWRNYWPVQGRTDYAVLFDRDFHPKPIVKTIIEEAKLSNN